MADSSAVDAALMVKLSSDATLLSLMTNNVHFDIAPTGSTKFVIVSQQAHEDEYQFGGSAWERFIYLVKAVAKDTSGDSVKQAAARIHTLLQDQSLTVTGYGVMNMQRTERIRYTEIDDATDARWQHRGGLYSVMVQPV